MFIISISPLKFPTAISFIEILQIPFTKY